MRRIAGTLAVALVAATLVGCGQGSSGTLPQTPGGSPSIAAAWTSCAVEVPDATPFGSAEATALPRLGDFVPTAAIVCATAPKRRGDGGEDLVATESRSDNVTDLVAALRLPDQPRTDDICTMDLPIVAWFALLDADGRWIRPGLPVDACGKIRIEVRKAVAALKLTETSSRPVKEIESSAAAASGCGQGYSDMISVEAGQPSTNSAATFSYPLAGAKQLLLCVFRVPASEQGTAKPAGSFESGLTLPPDRRAGIEKLLVPAGPARACTAHTNRFALLRSADNTGGQVFVELDGCQRLMSAPLDGPSALTQSSPALIALLTTP